MLVLITMWIMGIGMLTISFQLPSVDPSVAAGSKNVILTVTPDSSTTPSIEPTSTPTVTPIPEDPTLLKLNTDTNLNELIKTYYKAKLETDEETLTSIMTEASGINIEIISKVQEYIEGYEDIIIYTKPGVKEGDYVVYATYGMKITTIDTPAPSVDRLYVTTQNDKYLLSFGDLTQEEAKLLDSYTESEDVKDLITSVNKELEAAQAADSDLKEFILNLKKSLNTSQSSVQEEDEKEN